MIKLRLGDKIYLKVSDFCEVNLSNLMLSKHIKIKRSISLKGNLNEALIF